MVVKFAQIVNEFSLKLKSRIATSQRRCRWISGLIGINQISFQKERKYVKSTPNCLGVNRY